MTSAEFKHLFTPLKLNHVELKNRIVFGAHTANMAEAGLPGERHRGYYCERARGGAAMIVVEPVPVHPTAVLTRGNFRHDDDAIIPAFRTITDACHDHGAVMIHQLYHVGQHGDADNSYQPSWSPSGLPSYHDSDASHAMSEAEIEEIIEGFIAAARRARQSGFDGVEIFSAYHCIVDQFWTPWSNRRNDRWGGSFENRMRFSSRVLAGIRRACGNDFVIGFNISVDETTSVSLQPADFQEIVAWHDERGLMDYVSVGTGSYFNFTALIPTVFFADKLGAPYAAAIKEVVKHARVQAESHVRTPENADYVIASGAADMVSIVRGQIADPHLAAKAEAGHAGDIRPCLSCNQMCWGRRFRDYWISCLVNPSAGREFEWGGDRFEPADNPRTILIVGGGPAGLEAARVAGERGHRVILAEAASRLGGQFRLAGMQPRRGQIIDWLDWQERQLRRLQVEVRLNTPMDADDIAAVAADEVILATGSLADGSGFQRALPQHDRLPGIDRGNVFTVEQVMGREARPGKRVVVLDEGANWKGAGTAWHLAEAGHEVIVVTPAAMVAKELERTSGDIPLRARLKQLGARFFTEAALAEWTGAAALVRDLATGEDETVDADALVLSCANVAETWLAGQLTQKGIDHRTIGDCVAPRTAVMAIYEGRNLARRL